MRTWLTSTYPKGPKPAGELCGEHAGPCLDMDSDAHPPPAGVDANAVFTT